MYMYICRKKEYGYVGNIMYKRHKNVCKLI
jgi:hypothetical protein